MPVLAPNAGPTLAVMDGGGAGLAAQRTGQEIVDCLAKLPSYLPGVAGRWPMAEVGTGGDEGGARTAAEAGC